jgi:uncharacterized protein (DUF58 family)
LLRQRLRAFFDRGIRYRITRGGLLFLLALALTGAGAFLTANNLLFLVFSAMLALMVVSGLLRRQMLSGLELELVLPRDVAARAAIAAHLRLRNVKRFTPSFSIQLFGRPDPGSNLPPILSRPVYFPVVPGHQVLDAEVQVMFPRRGRHRDNLFVLATRFPFGFLHREATVPITRDTLVCPAIEPSSRAGELLRSVTARVDFYRIRPWEISDGVRLVDWKSTAHTGELQAREFAREDQAAVEIVLIRRIPAGAEADFEVLLEDCAWLIWTLAGRGAEFQLMCDGETIAVADPWTALRFLATVQPAVSAAGGETDTEPETQNVRVVLSI